MAVPMYLARDRNRFTKELQSLVGRSKKKDAVNQTAERLRAANEMLEAVVKPLFESYADLVRQVGRTCDYKVLPGSSESHPLRSAVADFLVDLSGVPGLSEYYLRFENDGDDIWKVTSRPRLDGKGLHYDVCEITLPVTDKLPSAIEGTLQQFIRRTF